MRIGIINCLKSNDCCTGAACLKAMNGRQKHFETYFGQELELTAFARCSGCEAGIDAGFQEKLDRIISEGTETVHFGKCTETDGVECPTVKRAAEYLSGHGIAIVRGTH